MAMLTNFVLLEKFEGYAILRIARPHRKNAMIPKMYGDISRHLQEVSDDENIKVVVLTGTGEYFTSGADLSGTDQPKQGQNKKQQANHFKDCIETLIKYPKPIIVAVNGPAIGIGVTLLGLCDVVYATDDATFLTPFSRNGMTPEACSSYTFSKIMGYAKANEMLLFNRMFSAHEAYIAGLVTEVFPKEVFVAEVQKRVEELIDNPIKSLVYGKQLIRGPEIPILLKVNEQELEQLDERHQSGDMILQREKFFEARKKIKEARQAKL
ncbi:enoyl-CoA delta isomerase 2 [Ciona intestinalis]